MLSVYGHYNVLIISVRGPSLESDFLDLQSTSTLNKQVIDWLSD